jgi:hypothetical protein
MKDIRRLWLACFLRVRRQFFAISKRNRYPGAGADGKVVLEYGGEICYIYEGHAELF